MADIGCQQEREEDIQVRGGAQYVVQGGQGKFYYQLQHEEEQAGFIERDSVEFFQ